MILRGDFNINLLKLDQNKEVNEFLDVLTSDLFTPQILGRARFVKHNKPSLVDNIFVDFSDMQCTSGNTHLDSKFKTLKRDLQHFTPKKLDFLE